MKKKYIAPELDLIRFDVFDRTNNGEESNIAFDPGKYWDEDPFEDYGFGERGW